MKRRSRARLRLSRRARRCRRWSARGLRQRRMYQRHVEVEPTAGDHAVDEKAVGRRQAAIGGHCGVSAPAGLRILLAEDHPANQQTRWRSATLTSCSWTCRCRALTPAGDAPDARPAEGPGTAPHARNRPDRQHRAERRRRVPRCGRRFAHRQTFASCGPCWRLSRGSQAGAATKSPHSPVAAAPKGLSSTKSRGLARGLTGRLVLLEVRCGRPFAGVHQRQFIA